ncbi:MAG: 50S ribosomal protein L3 [Candidatus Moranbacteria bacterium CG_4_10_14_3_um_filter_44_15]|nr:MAG: 50S ribosomal protein L3 [Candidatus Moranbacteria bacterium CG06_land_8_20_14_3_00_43_56]PIV84114.1 MAG: 50S ribosomal protein L3 [Candidatus Moranbacteria bacterium CG17_big_fil_post_rev_8_21_14_2_50_44_12]PIW93429.1 MAG: 50S ribosomal protein L3 [Candidatus Moranbacteria bacterium CG_4_8_14_3_um_filter_43_15]PIX90799.1 MAG: 50S ribosomal protein L3 [Candidatus Moranbacteria bacterium CG_4_10_14_3_um_filter_44_15]PJA86234.1 MAG: 50S ribosomal protein L3 [Candidatus Moranbacteria bacte
MKFILGKKLGMSTIYDEKKGALNVTLVECGPNVITQLRSSEKDGCEAVQIGLRKRKAQSAKRKAKEIFFKIKEFRGEIKDLKIGDAVDINQFQVGDKVKVSGISKGKGFQGVVKRHGFKGSSHSHGHKHDWRAPGSIGSSFPEHVVKGKKMAGRMGGVRASVKNLEIVEIDKENNILFLRGAVPGVKGRIVEIVGI